MRPKATSTLAIWVVDNLKWQQVPSCHLKLDSSWIFLFLIVLSSRNEILLSSLFCFVFWKNAIMMFVPFQKTATFLTPLPTMCGFQGDSNIIYHKQHCFFVIIVSSKCTFNVTCFKSDGWSLQFSFFTVNTWHIQYGLSSMVLFSALRSFPLCTSVHVLSWFDFICCLPMQFLASQLLK